MLFPLNLAVTEAEARNGLAPWGVGNALSKVGNEGRWIGLCQKSINRMARSSSPGRGTVSPCKRNGHCLWCRAP